MRQRKVVFAETALKDIDAIYERIFLLAGWESAGRYIDRLEQFCQSLDIASERGTLRADVRSQLRVIGFRKSISVAFEVDDDAVRILHLIPSGRDWAKEFDEGNRD